MFFGGSMTVIRKHVVPRFDTADGANIHIAFHDTAMCNSLPVVANTEHGRFADVTETTPTEPPKPDETRTKAGRESLLFTGEMFELTRPDDFPR